MSLPDPAVAAPKKLMTVDEFWEFVNLPENDNRFLELRQGEVVEVYRPTRRHGAVSSNVALELGLFARRIGRGYVATNDTGVILEENPATVVGPDVAYFTDANTFDEVHPKWGEEVPVLAVEALSPIDRMSEVNDKIKDYLTGGVRLVWLVDYEKKWVTVYRPDKTLTVLKEPDTITGGDEVPGLSLTVADFFRLPGDRPVPTPQPPAA